MKHVLRGRIVLSGLLSTIGYLPGVLLGDTDFLEGPWGTVHADLAGTAATTDLAYGLGTGPLEEKWRLDVVTEHDRPAGRSSIVFDKEGNLYWITNTGGGTGGLVQLVSVSPDGKIRWTGNDGAGNVEPIGTIFSGASPVVGAARVYATGDLLGTLALTAFDKTTGGLLWTADLSPSTVSLGAILTPVLYEGKLYAIGLSDGKSRDVYRVDAETGEVDWFSNVPEVGISTTGQMAFVPNVFAKGEHGLYFNGDSSSGTDGVGEVYGIHLTAEAASLAWASDGGKVARSHVIYSGATGLLYTFTWADYGAEAYVFDPVNGLVTKYMNSLNTGHGFYDVGALDFDGGSLIAGGFDGNILRYTDDGGGALTDQVVYKGGTRFSVPYWGESRVLGQLLQAPSGNSILISGTNSFQCCSSHVFALDVTEGKLLWEYDTGNHNDHQFIYAGGPLLGPDGKIYYFERPAAGVPTLVAVGLAEKDPQPSAGFIVVEAEGRAVGTVNGGADPCVKGGERARFDGSCSTGRNLVYRYSVDPPEGATVFQASEADPAAEIRFDRTGTFNVTLEVENAGGTAQCTRTVCVDPVQPRCSMAVTDLAGGPIDTADDGDDVPCLPAGGTALADAAASTGGDLEFSFSVTPPGGVSIDQQGGPADPKANLTFADPGVYRIGLTVSNGAGQGQCAAKTICVKAVEAGKKFLRGDCNSDGTTDLTDAVTHLGALFLGDPEPPCLEACDSNGDGSGDLSDAVHLLSSLFLGGSAPPPPNPNCGPGAVTPLLGCDKSSC
jgi:outer membrane protein assembly factor BamB